MRIWDINPGYLNRHSLLGEHNELHAAVSIIENKKKGFAHHPEVRRWTGYGWALRQRHGLLACEMALRGYNEKTPVLTMSNRGCWPLTYLTMPDEQFTLLEERYIGKEKGRIPLPKNEQMLWSHHKYSVLARDPNEYKRIGRWVTKREIGFSALALLLVELLRMQPAEGGIHCAVERMWGHVSHVADRSAFGSWSLRELLCETQKRALAVDEIYLIRSTALSELMVWV